MTDLRIVNKRDITSDKTQCYENKLLEDSISVSPDTEGLYIGVSEEYKKHEEIWSADFHCSTTLTWEQALELRDYLSAAILAYSAFKNGVTNV